MYSIIRRNTKLILILDKDIKKDVSVFMSNHKKYKYLNPDYLPISSLEKYLKQKLVCDVDNLLYRKLDNYLFQRSFILHKYITETDIQDDMDGKTLFGYLINELRGIRKDRENLSEIVVKHLVENDGDLVDIL